MCPYIQYLFLHKTIPQGVCVTLKNLGGGGGGIKYHEGLSVTLLGGSVFYEKPTDEFVYFPII
jgi:hypothetical protein